MRRNRRTTAIDKGDPRFRLIADLEAGKVVSTSSLERLLMGADRRAQEALWRYHGWTLAVGEHTSALVPTPGSSGAKARDRAARAVATKRATRVVPSAPRRKLPAAPRVKRKAPPPAPLRTRETETPRVRTLQETLQDIKDRALALKGGPTHDD